MASPAVRVWAMTPDMSNAQRIGLAEVTYANRPTSPTVGDLCNISDSSTATWGATVAGSSTNHVLARWNGTNWTVVGA